MSIGTTPRTGPRRTTFSPIRILDLEVSEATDPILPATRADGRRYERAWVLVRMHRSPMGAVEVRLATDGSRPDDLPSVIERELGSVIARHLVADAAAEIGGPAGVPACQAARNAVLHDGPPASVIVPVVDRPAALRRCLEGLAAQSYPRFEVVVVDNAPGTSGAGAVVDELASLVPHLRLVEEATRGASRARNRGLAEARHEVVAFLDGDVRPDPDWLAASIASLVTPVGAAPPTCVTGTILPLAIETRAQAWLEEWGGYGKGFERRAFDLGGHRPRSPLFPYAIAACGSGASMIMRRRDVIELGGFDEALGGGTPAGSGEDLALLLDIVAAGGTILYEPAAIVWHEHPATAAQLRRTLAAYGRGLTAYLARHVVRHPGELARITAALPAAAWYFARPHAGRNRGRSPDFPAWAWPVELLAMLEGPVAYGIGRWQRRDEAPAASPATGRAARGPAAR